MKIPLDRLSATPTSFAFEGQRGWWQAGGSPQRPLPETAGEPFRFAVAAHRMGEDVYLEGAAEGMLALECSRCLARYRHRLREPFRLVLEPAGERNPADPEGANALARDGVCLGDELESGWFRGATIDLGAFFLEILALALPVKPLCREDCAGLCPRCGAERNTRPCDCVEIRSDSPFAALAALRGELTRGES